VPRFPLTEDSGNEVIDLVVGDIDIEFPIPNPVQVVQSLGDDAGSLDLERILEPAFGPLTDEVAPRIVMVRLDQDPLRDSFVGMGVEYDRIGAVERVAAELCQEKPRAGGAQLLEVLEYKEAVELILGQTRVDQCEVKELLLQKLLGILSVSSGKEPDTGLVGALILSETQDLFGELLLSGFQDFLALVVD